MRLIAGVVLGVVVTVPAWGAFRATPFDGLRDELTRREEALGGPLDRTGKKRRKAVKAAARAIDKPARDLRYDVKAAGKTAKKLGRVFGDEFTPAATVPQLGALYRELLTEIALDLEDRRALLAAGLDDVAFGPDVRYATLLERLAAALEAEAAAPRDDLALRASHLRRAAKAYVAAARIGAHALAHVHAAVDGAAWKSSFSLVTYDPFGGALMLAAKRDFTRPSTVRESLHFTVRGVRGPGRFELSAGDSAFFHSTDDNELFTTTGASGSGTVTIDVFDLDGREMSGTFSFDLHLGGQEEPVLRIRDGRFRVNEGTLIVP